MILPASRFSPSLPPTTHEALHKPQTKRSFPSFIQPHLDAATASTAGDLLEYVDSLYVPSRSKKEGKEEGRYSAVVGSNGAGDGDCDENLNVKLLFVFDAALERIAER